MKTWMGAAVAAVLVALSAEGASERRIVASGIAYPLSLDGVLDEQAYVDASWTDPFTVMDPESKEINALYLAADAKFTALNTRVAAFVSKKVLYCCVIAPYPADVPPDDSESVEFHFAADGRTVSKISVSVSGRIETSTYDAATLAAGAAKVAGVSAAVRRGKDSFTVEMAVPLKSLGVDTKRPPASIACNLIRRGASTGGQSSWAPTNREQPDPEQFGRLFFGESKEETVGESLAENRGKTAFFWGDDPWRDTKQMAQAPVDRPELAKVVLAGPRGARAVGAFRISNLTDRHQIYNISVISKDTNVVRRLRVREVGYLELRGGEFVPDPVFELPIGSVLRIAPKSTAIVWLDADFSGLTPGVHKAKLRFMPGYGKDGEKILPVELSVGKADVSEVRMRVHYYHQGSNRMTASILKEFGVNVVVCNINSFPLREDGTGADYTRMDGSIDAFLEAGIPKDELNVRIDLQLPRWATAGFPKEMKRKLKFLDPDWKRLYADRIKAAVGHLREKYGIGYDRIEIKVQDEPSGDPADPASKAYAAIEAAKFLKASDPRLLIGCNPWNTDPRHLQSYLDSFDLLEPEVRRLMEGRMDRSIADRYRASGREVSSYIVYVKQNTVHQYRRGYWANLDYGFDGYCAIYGLIAQSGDSFNSYDFAKKNSKCRSDWNAAYCNADTGMITPSRRLESWYQGLVDMKLVKWCRRRIAERKAKGEDVSAFEKEIAETITAANQPRSDLSAARARILALSDRML